MDKRLKKIQTRIKIKIFNCVSYPEYLQGSIKDKQNPRSYHQDAAIHADSNFIISEDVSNFFHSIDESHVINMWKYLFCFSKNVAEILTRLTTFNGYVPQGGVTSSYIANLIMWDIEPELVDKLDKLNVRYTRYVDDVTLSSNLKWLPQNIVEESIKSVYAMLGAKGLKPNREKHQIMSRNNKMPIHNLNVNSGRLTMGRAKRSQIRLEVYNLKKLSKVCERKGDEYRKLFDSLSGKVRELHKFHPVQGDQYLEVLEKIPPISNK